MAWLDLQADIAEDFASYGSFVPFSLPRIVARPTKSQRRHADSVARAWEYAGARRRRKQRRKEKAAERPPCCCGTKIERDSGRGPLPKYHADACRRRASQLARQADPKRRAAEQRNAMRLRADRRGTKAATRPPCPHCNGKVERVGKTGKIPTYCTSKCMRAARWARWYEKHGTERNDRRRKWAPRP